MTFSTYIAIRVHLAHSRVAVMVRCIRKWNSVPSCVRQSDFPPTPMKEALKLSISATITATSLMQVIMAEFMFDNANERLSPVPVRQGINLSIFPVFQQIATRWNVGVCYRWFYAWILGERRTRNLPRLSLCNSCSFIMTPNLSVTCFAPLKQDKLWPFSLRQVNRKVADFFNLEETKWKLLSVGESRRSDLPGALDRRKWHCIDW